MIVIYKNKLWIFGGDCDCRGKSVTMTNGSIDIDDTQGDVSAVIKDRMGTIAAKSVYVCGDLVINNSTLEDRETLKKIQELPTEINASEKDNVTREEFIALKGQLGTLISLVQKNLAFSIKAGDVQVSRTELSVKEIILKGNECFDRGDYSITLDFYDEAIKIDANYADTWNNKGLALYNLGKYNEAIESCDRAIKIDPNNAYAWYNKGNALYALRKYNEAMGSYDRAIKIDPNYAMKICQ
ncbi:MAG: tetratricopeptide repeat protein [Candidatus Nitrosopolaris sp.]